MINKVPTKYRRKFILNTLIVLPIANIAVVVLLLWWVRVFEIKAGVGNLAIVLFGLVFTDIYCVHNFAKYYIGLNEDKEQVKDYNQKNRAAH